MFCEKWSAAMWKSSRVRWPHESCGLEACTRRLEQGGYRNGEQQLRILGGRMRISGEVEGGRR